MPKTLNESSVYVGGVTVPEGTDSRDDAADAVELLAQQLTNRTRYLKDVHDLLDLAAAKLDEVNTFTRQIKVEHPDDPAEALLRSTKTAADSTANPGNKWKQIFAFRTDPNRSARVYTGVDLATEGSFILTVNAFWNVTGANANKWEKEVAGDSSFALIVRNENMFVSRMDTSAQTWTSWPDQGVIDTHRVRTTDNVEADADVVAGGDVIAAGEIKHSPSRARTSNVPLLPVLGSGASQASFISGVLTATGTATGAFISIPLRIPLGVTTFNLRISLTQNGSIPSAYRIVRVVPNMSSGGSSTYTAVQEVYSDAVPGADMKGILITAGDNINAAAEAYYFQWRPGQVGDQLFGLGALGWDESLKVASW